MDLKKPISELYMVGPTYAKRLNRLGIKTVGDFLYHFPFRYLDYSLVSKISQIQPGETVSIKGKIIDIKNQYTFRGKKIQKGKVKDNTGIIEVVWFNQPYLVKTLKIGTAASLSGKVDFWGKTKALISPEYEVIPPPRCAPPAGGQQPPQTCFIHTGRLVPVYHETYGVSSKWLRSRIAALIKTTIPTVEEFLPTEILRKHRLINLDDALVQVHFPIDNKNAEIARNRFAFEELFLIQLAALERKRQWKRKKLAQQFVIDREKILKFTQNLPFELTNAQKKVLREIFRDLEKNQPMNRLLEGDVGSGKTVVAAAAIYLAYLNQSQSALMAPTEILANQHYKTLNQLLKPLGVKISLLTSAKKKGETDFDLLVGTHALIHKRAKFKNLGLVVIDEQHRFGVEQRGELTSKGKTPHVLTMTATPIPRTIALTVWGNLELSVLDEMPPGRQEIKTWVIPPQKRTAAYDWIRKQIKETKSRAFIICPLIEESLYETLKTVKAVKSEYERLKKGVFPDLKLGLLHGRLKTEEKQDAIEKFKKGDYDILVSTPVVEVGIDIPQATIMIIEEAQRFGLAQLHQLRGRVGRGNQPSYCLLFAQKSLPRLKAMERINIGMKLAELDLKMRGPGEIYGTQQHGFLNLKIASFSDLPLIEKTKRAAEEFIDKINQFSLLKERLNDYIIKQVEPN